MVRSPVEVGSWNPMIYRGFMMHPNGGFLAGFLVAYLNVGMMRSLPSMSDKGDEVWSSTLTEKWMLWRGCFLKWWYPRNTPKWSFLVGKTHGFVGYHHFRKPPSAAGELLLHIFRCLGCSRWWWDQGHLPNKLACGMIWLLRDAVFVVMI